LNWKVEAGAPREFLWPIFKIPPSVGTAALAPSRALPTSAELSPASSRVPVPVLRMRPGAVTVPVRERVAPVGTLTVLSPELKVRLFETEAVPV
jgi:hypothetical protein